MSNKSSRDWTVIVMRPGEETRSYAVGMLRRACVGLAFVVSPIAILALGYHLGSHGELERAKASIASIVGSEAGAGGLSAPEAPARQLPPTAHVAAVASAEEQQAAEDRSSAINEAPHELGNMALPEEAPSDSPENRDMAPDGPEDKALSLRIINGTGDVAEIHPFDANGQPMRGAFGQLRDLMACKDATSVMPNARLVRLLVEAQHHFKQSVRILGGHCAAHDDRFNANAHHAEGRAADIRVWGITSARLMAWLQDKGVPGIGRYARKGFVHIDLRAGKQARWEPTRLPKGSGQPRSGPVIQAKTTKSPVIQASEAGAEKTDAKPTPTNAKAGAATTRAKKPGSQ